MESCLEKDDGMGILEIIIECPDMMSRVNVKNLMVFILKKLAIIENEYLYDQEKSLCSKFL